MVAVNVLVAVAVNVLVAVAEAVIVPVVVMVVVPMVLRGYEIKVKWMALFRDIIFCAFLAVRDLVSIPS